MDTADSKLMQPHLMQTYAPLPVEFVRGSGVHLTDSQGESYLDALGGIAVCALGHSHPQVTAAIQDQAATLLHTSNLYRIPNQLALADKLAGLAGMQRVFFSNSGAEANEAAIKLARLYGHQKGIDNPSIIVTEGSFHGRTMATLSATGNRKVQAGFEPLVSGFIRVPFDDLEAVERIAETNPNVVAVLLEPITGEGGIRVPDDAYLPGLRALCDNKDWLMMVDEIQTGIGRTGRWFAHQHAGIKPDVMTLAKALGNGVPIGACLANDKAADVFQPGTHGSTFGGNPLATAAASAVLDAIEKEDLVTRAGELGTRMRQRFQEQLGERREIVSIRGRGLMIGVELDRPCAELVGMALAERLLINVTAGNVVRLLPPYILSNAQADDVTDKVCDLILRFLDTDNGPNDA